MGPSNSPIQNNVNLTYEDEAYFFSVNPYLVEQKQKNQPQYRSIGAIISTYKGNHFKGTACLIAPNVIVTVAHNIFYQKSQTGKHNEKITFYPQAYGILGQGIKAIKIDIPEQYLKGSKAITYDFAICILEKDVPQPFCIDIGYNYEYDKNIHSNAETIDIFGYSGQKWKKRDPNIESYNYSVQLKGLRISKESFETRILQTNLQLGEIKHKISTQAGHSGAPILANIDGKYIVIGLHKGAMGKQYNGGVLFNQFFIRRLKSFLNQQKIYNIRILNLSTFSWEQNMIENSPFQIEDTKIVRINSSGQEKKRIRSIVLNKLFSVDQAMSLRFKNFRYMQNISCMQFGVVILAKERRDEITYITARNINRNEGNIKIRGKTLFRDYPKEMFVAEEEHVDITVDCKKLSIVFVKGNQTNSVSLDKELLQESSIVVFAEMRCDGDSLQVQKIMIE